MKAAPAPAELPTDRDELWRYTPVKEIIARMERSVAAPSGVPTSVPRSLIDALTGATGPRLVFVNGFYAAELSDHHDLPTGLRCGVAGDQHPPTTALVSRSERLAAVDGFASLNHVDGADIAVVAADDGVCFDEPIHIVHLAVPDPIAEHSVASHPRTIIDVGEAAHLAVVETYGGLDDSTVSNVSTTIRVGDRAELVHYRVQIEAPAATHIGHTRIDQGAGSLLRMTSVTLGGDIARNAIEVHLDAPDARTELTGINMTGGRQRHDTVVTVDHAASRCSSNQRFTGVVDDHGRGSFSGEIIVRPGTTATDAHQSSRNLVLDPNAEADARPWLRILADDVRCTHGATVGRLDDDALHYLRSRGIALPQARTMLIDAFLRDITDSISHKSVRTHVAALVACAATTPSSVAPTPTRAKQDQ